MTDAKSKKIQRQIYVFAVLTMVAAAAFAISLAFTVTYAFADRTHECEQQCKQLCELNEGEMVLLSDFGCSCRIRDSPDGSRAWVETYPFEGHP